jgi:hypothetical protein
VGSPVNVINRTKPWIAVLLSFIVTRYDFNHAALEVQVCRSFRIRVPYAKIRSCATKLSHRRIVIFGRVKEETSVRRVIIRGVDGMAVVFRVDDFESFLAQLRERAPQAEVWALKSNKSTITAARKAGFPWLNFNLKRENFDGMNASAE